MRPQPDSSSKARPQAGLFRKFVSGVALLAIWLGTLGITPGAAVLAAPPPLAAASRSSATNTLHIKVVSATDAGTILPSYKFLINQDNTGDPKQPRSPLCDPDQNGSLAGCNWPSIRTMPGDAPIVTQGTDADLAGGLNLPDGKYLISVVADGYKIGGAHFSIPLDEPGLVNVELEPNPLPTSTFRAMVFEDNALPDGQFDSPAEHGLNGFEVHLDEILGQISTDWYGNPLCTEYDGNHNGSTPAGDPIPGTGGKCLTGDSNHDGVIDNKDDPADAGMVVIPNLGTNRVAALAVPPDGTTWVQTDTLEGWHDYDTWLIEGATGYDTEFLNQNELFPWTLFGFVRPTGNLPAGPSGELKGNVWSMKAYVPPQGGQPFLNGGLMGGKKDYPIDRPYIGLSDLNNGDQMIYMGRGDSSGNFDIQNIPPGDYNVSVWDAPQSHILDIFQVTISDTVNDMGVVPLLGWWSDFKGSVFIDTNGNGKRDAGEQGLPNQAVGFKMRGNNVMQHGTTGITTDNDGNFDAQQVYPITSWIVMEVYNDLYYTTGITYQADNGPETTVLGQGVDVNILPIIGLSGRIDWGVRPYSGCDSTPCHTQNADGTFTNGGIVGTVTYDVTRNEIDPRFAATEDWQPGIPGLQVDLFKPVPCTSGHTCDPSGKYQVETDGSFSLGDANGVPTSVDNPIDSYTSESWERPTGCTALDVDGHPIAQHALPTDPSADCVEAPMSGIQFGPMADGGNFGASVDGNYGFGDLAPGNYLVKVEIPEDPILHRPLYKVTKEEDINVFSGDDYAPQVPPPACAGATHQVHVVDDPSQAHFDPLNPHGTSGIYNPTFIGEGGSPFEGQWLPLCDVKLIPVQTGKSIAPNFNLFTDVPLPSRYMGLLVDNANLSVNDQSTSFGEAAGIPNSPVGIYDFRDHLLDTIQSDPNGIWEVLMPSSLQINCPTPSGVCPDMYRFVGNDPGQPGQLNSNHNPQYQTIAAPFEGWPGVINPADLAPMPIAATIWSPGSQISTLALCATPTTTPQLFAVDKPYINGPSQLTILGDAFGDAQGSGTVTLGGQALNIVSWANGQIVASVSGAVPLGPQMLRISNGAGQSTVNGLTIHVMGYGPFPSAGILDTFTRNNNNNSLGGNWNNDASNGVFQINSNSARVRTGGNVNNNNTVNDSWYGTANANNYGQNQEAFFTLSQISTQAGANEQGLLLKYSGGQNPNANQARWIEVAYNYATLPANRAVQVRVKTNGFGGGITTQATFPVNLTNGDALGARALSNGTIIVYQNGSELGRVTVNGTANWTGRIGVRFEGTGTTPATEARFDDFGGGSLTNSYAPSLYEVGPGKPYSTIQAALTAASSNATALVVVYPNAAVPSTNPNGEYYENVVMYSPAKLQGVGPGGVRADGSIVPGSIIDGVGYNADTTYATNWFNLVNGITPVGNTDISDGQVVYVLATGTNQYGSAFKAAIDGFTIQGGDQKDFPGNINEIGGGQVTGGRAHSQGFIPTQGGGIFVNGYANFLQITNNVIQSNGGSYAGAIRVGTPENSNPVPNDNHNDNLRIAYNRILANGGTNLAGAIGLFRGTNNYEIDHNDLCGNYSAEYGGAISNYGQPHPVGGNNPLPVSRIHDNRIYFNQSVDEGGAIMIAGELPANLAANYYTPNGAQGAGSVDIYNNLIQSNTANDDGGGIRFLMAGGHSTYNVYNNTIVNNVSTHEGGGVAIDDAPNIRFYNNTVMKNITTATAATVQYIAGVSQADPAGLSTTSNSLQLQNTLPSGSSTFSNPVLFNNIFWDNRAGWFDPNQPAFVVGIGLPNDGTPIHNWDMGVVGAGAGDLLSPTNSILQTTVGTTGDGSNVAADPQVVLPFDAALSIFPWRAPNLQAPVTVAVNLPQYQNVGNYHLQSGSPAVNLGAGSKNSVNAPTFDIDNQPRPNDCWVDSGADETQDRPLCADLAITKTDGSSTALAGRPVTYTLSVTNSGPSAVNGAVVADTLPVSLTGATWTCVASNGSSCAAASGSGNPNTTANLTVNGSATLTVTATLSASATGTLANTATVTVPAGYIDPVSGNNSATDTDTVVVPSLHVGNLNGALNNSNSQWSATVTITVHDQNHGLLSGAVVTGSWSNGGGQTTCTTSAAGTCQVTSASLNKAPASASVTFTVGNLARAGYIYQSSANHDPDASSDGTAITVSVPPMHIGDLDRSSTNTNANNWSATVTITVHNGAHGVVANATVTGSWSVGGTPITCTTNALGICTLNRTGLSRASVASITFTVSNVTSNAALVYQSASNHDPDFGAQSSDGTTITVPRP